MCNDSIDMIYTNEIIKDKFWIVEESGVKVGTIRKCSSDTFEINIRDDGTEQTTMSGLMTRFGEKILESKQPAKEVIEENKLGARGWNTLLSTVEGYPSKHKAHNINTIEVGDKLLPSYTKSETSRVIYVAGYYGIHFTKRWQGVYGTKLDTLEEYEFIGPFKSKSEMDTEVLLQNKRNV
tara:strand:+ start:2397 stop:2936 length:540 start_codon:yes stop_codon:yes gene_type:complete